jgi:hypothetical protein
MGPAFVKIICDTMCVPCGGHCKLSLGCDWRGLFDLHRELPHDIQVVCSKRE